jgi:hypothetical protein
MVGLDTSHCVAFSKILMDDGYEYHLPGAVITGAYPGGSQQFALSRDRVIGFTNEIKNTFGIPIFNTIPELIRDVDAVLLLSGDGRQHLSQFGEMAYGKPIFIDKPMAVSSREAYAISRLAERTQTPIMSCSSLRFAAGLSDGERATLQRDYVEAFGPAPVYDDYPGWFWYGIHSVEILFSIMGKGCRRVQCISHSDVDLALGEWQDGRVGIVRGTRLGNYQFGYAIFSQSGIQLKIAKEKPPFYFLLLEKVLGFLRTGTPPVEIEETLNIIGFVEAVNKSIEKNGQFVEIQ